MKLLSHRLAAVRRSGDSGMGLLLVVGTSIAAMMAAMTVAVIGINSLHSSAQHVSFEQALSAAEAGIDDQLSLIQAANDQDPPVDYTTPSPCNSTGSTPSSFASADAERTWAKSVINSLPASCTMTVSSGQYVAFRPAGLQSVYSMGWSPSRTATHPKVRLLKAEYLFGPYKPADAILTNGDLNFSGSVITDYVGDATSADVHTNGDLTSNGSGSLNIAGQVSASGSNALGSGTCPGGVTGPCTAGAPLERVNVPGPRQIYNAMSRSYSDWYDLCPDGTIRTPNPTSGAAPCTGTQVGTAPYRGWTYTAGSDTAAPVWTLVNQSGTTYQGAYYAYHGDAQVGANGNDATTWNISVLAESGTPGTDADVPSSYTNTSSCNAYGGNIDWKLFTIQQYLPGTVFVADANLTGSATTDAGDGMFYAGNKVVLKTSSSTITGAVVAGNKCAAAGASDLQGMKIHYDQNAQVPVSSLIDTTLWLEYVG
jgi:hypothetical protein